MSTQVFRKERVEWVCGCHAWVWNCDGHRLPVLYINGLLRTFDSVESKIESKRFHCGSTLCCQRHIDRAQVEVRRQEVDKGIPPGGNWGQRDKSKYPFPDGVDHREVEAAFERRRYSIKKHLDCLEMFAKGEGLSNAIRMAQNEQPQMLHQIVLPARPDNQVPKVPFTRDDHKYPMLQAAYEDSPAGVDDWARYHKYHPQHNPNYYGGSITVQAESGSPGQQTICGAQTGGTSILQCDAYQQAIVGRGGTSGSGAISSPGLSSHSSAMAGSSRMAAMASSSSLPYRLSPTSPAGPSHQEEHPNDSPPLTEDFFNIFGAEQLEQPPPLDPKAARLVEIEQHVATLLNIIQNIDKFSTIPRVEQPAKFVQHCLHIAKAAPQTQNMITSLETQQSIPQVFDETRFQNLKQRTRNLLSEIQLYHAQLKEWYKAQAPASHQQLMGALQQRMSLVQRQTKP